MYVYVYVCAHTRACTGACVWQYTLIIPALERQKQWKSTEFKARLCYRARTSLKTSKAGT